jgi:hypothetical protein
MTRQQHAAPDQYLPCARQEVPVYAHLPTVLNEQGEKNEQACSGAARDAVRPEGYLPRW